MKKCVLCDDEVEEEHGKLKGTMVRALNEQGGRDMIHVCSGCQKVDDWMEDALVKGV